jgi:hypothetical protein
LKFADQPGAPADDPDDDFHYSVAVIKNGKRPTYERIGARGGFDIDELPGLWCPGVSRAQFQQNVVSGYG